MRYRICYIKDGQIKPFTSQSIEIMMEHNELVPAELNFTLAAGISHDQLVLLDTEQDIIVGIVVQEKILLY